MSEETQQPDPVPGHAESPAPVEDAGTTQDVGEAAPGRSGEGSNPGAGTHTGAQTVAGGIATWPPPQPQPQDVPVEPPASPPSASPWTTANGAPEPATPAPPAAVPFTYPPPTPPAASSAGGTRGGGMRIWLPVAIVAAVIGAGIGAGVGVAVSGNGDTSSGGVTIHESNAAPGAAVLSGNVTIPQLVDKVIHAVVSIDVKSGSSEDQGTGMIITSDGEVITNNHVIELYVQGGRTGTITVTEYGQTKPLPTSLIGYDETKDVALLKIDNTSGLSTVTFGNSSKAVVGDAVVAIGNALGLAAGTPTVTQGIVSALGRSVTAGDAGSSTETLQNMIQTDAAINPGNSGGPLIDTSAQVIGMNTAVAGTSSDGTTSQNIGFAIPIAQVESLLPTLQKGGQTANGGGYLGVDITTLTPALRQQYGFTPTQGAVVLSVVPGSPADKAGLVQGDVIVNIDGKAITSAEDLQKVVQAGKPGQTISITYYVGNSKRTTSATLGNQTQAQPAPSGNSGGTP